MRFLLTALTLLTATAAWSQTLQITLPNNQTELRVSKDCDLVRTVNWAHNITSQPCDAMRFWFVEGSCSDEPPSGTSLVDSVPAANVPSPSNGTVSFKVRDLPGLKDTCPVEDKETTFKLCASVPLRGGAALDCSSKNWVKDDATVIYDAQAPGAPTIDNVAALDKALSIRVGVPSDANRVRIVIMRADGTGSRTFTQSSDQPLFRVEGLENDVEYTITATALDAADNESAPSEAQTGTPIFTRGFFDRYVEANGQELGGCGAAGSLTGGWVLAVLGFWLSSRRNRS
jgi:uncharacterized protein (TIGR03382 family)